ncbi:GMC family oxidoreductase [Klebsiella pneumoniae]|nr:GMC family oxidoreductase [Klebsiella pneumoniae]
MATVLKKTDVAIVGFGWVGAIMAKELTEAGLNVVALERGPMRDTWPDGAYPQVIDELTYNIRRKLFQDLSKSTVTIRHNTSQQAVPYRQLAAFLPGTGVGGAGLHWSGVHFRVDPIELRMRSHYEERYGKNFIPQDMIIQDFGVTYDELEPFFDKAEKVFGTSGTAWSIKGKVVGKGRGGNAFAPDRSDDFPLPAQKNTWSAQLFEKAALEVGYHPYNLPSANTSDSYTNPYGAGGNGVGVDDFNADNFDHGAAGFVGGSPFWVNQAGTKPISGFPVPPGTPAWGSKWKAAVADTYTHHLSMDAHGAHQSYRQNYLDLDPNYKNVFGQPLLRMTFDWQENDIKMAQFMFDKMAPIAKAMKPKYILGSPKNANSHFDTTTYQTTHMNGGAVMGEDPKTSAVNRYLQSWDVHNVFVIGASAFPQGLGYNPTGTVAALAYWSAKAIREQYLKNPGPLVQA